MAVALLRASARAAARGPVVGSGSVAGIGGWDACQLVPACTAAAAVSAGIARFGLGSLVGAAGWGCATLVPWMLTSLQVVLAAPSRSCARHRSGDTKENTASTSATPTAGKPDPRGLRPKEAQQPRADDRARIGGTSRLARVLLDRSSLRRNEAQCLCSAGRTHRQARGDTRRPVSTIDRAMPARSGGLAWFGHHGDACRREIHAGTPVRPPARPASSRRWASRETRLPTASTLATPPISISAGRTVAAIVTGRYGQPVHIPVNSTVTSPSGLTSAIRIPPACMLI
jgi:hypothetical protein